MLTITYQNTNNENSIYFEVAVIKSLIIIFIFNFKVATE